MHAVFQIAKIFKLYNPLRLFWFAVCVFVYGLNIYAILKFYTKVKPRSIAAQVDGVSMAHEELLKKIAAFHNHFRLQLSSSSTVGVVMPNSMELIVTILSLSLLNKQTYLISPKAKNLKDLKDRHHLDVLLQLEDVRKIDESNERLRRKDLKLGRVSILTSGTTGAQKPVTRKFKAKPFVSVFVDLIKRLELAEVRACYIGVPLYHGYGLATLMMSLILGKKVVVDGNQFVNWFSTSSRIQNSLLALVPIQLDQLLEQENILLNGEKVVVGGAPLSQRTFEKLKKMHPESRLYNLYGTSESGVSFLAELSMKVSEPVNVGVPLRGVEWRIKEERLWLRTPWSHTVDWVDTGDRLEQLDDGRFVWKGRADDMIISGGINAFPSELEEVVLTYPEVVDAKAEAVHDEKYFQRFRLKITTKELISIERFKQELTNRLPPHLVPMDVILVDEIKRNELGK